MVTLEAHNPEWATLYRAEAHRIRLALPRAFDELEHIGSTAIPGLHAKPVIDIAARAPRGVDALSFADVLAAIGYKQHRRGPKTHGIYIRSLGAERTHILHVFGHSQWQTCNQRLFVAKLVSDPVARERYDRVKLSLAASAIDGQDYTAAKTAVIEQLVNEERIARGLEPILVWDK